MQDETKAGSELSDQLGRTSHKLKFKVGDTVRVIADKHAAICSHGRKIGKAYTIVKTSLESREGPNASNYQEYRLSGPGKGWVCEDEIEAA